MRKLDERGPICFSHFCTKLTVLLMLGGVGCRSDSVAQSTRAFAPGRGFVQCQMTFDGKPRPLWVFLPNEYSPDEKFPAIVFLHGLFESGNGDAGCLKGGLGPVIA